MFISGKKKLSLTFCERVFTGYVKHLFNVHLHLLHRGLLLLPHNLLTPSPAEPW